MTEGINSLDLRDEVTDEVPSELPEQMGGSSLPVLMPGISLFRIPSNVAQCVEAFDEEDKAADGSTIMVPDKANPSVMVPKVTQRLRVKFDKDNPLIVVGNSADDPNAGHPVATQISNQPRNRAKKTEPPNKVADMTYLIRISLADVQSPLSRPKEWLAAILKMAGRVFRAEHGLSAYCNDKKVRYVNDPADASGRGSIEDPDKQLGCGTRAYTKDFRLPKEQGGGFSDLVYCKKCGAKLRGFFQIERFLPPTPGQQ